MKSKSRKLSLIGTIFVSMLSVCSAGVSTFAWFQAQANVNITTSSTSTSITVSKPDEFVFYGYRGNVDSSHIIGARDINDDGIYDFNDDFEEITSANVNAKTLFDGEVGHGNKFNPGDVKCFALYFNNHEVSNNIHLEINNMISQTINNVDESKHRLEKYDGRTYEINVGWAINAYSMLVTDLTNHIPDPSTYSTFACSATGKTTAQGNDGTDRIILSRGSNVIGTSNGNNINLNTVNGSTSSIDLYPATPVSATEGYIFYTISFLDNLTMRYKECTQAADTALLTPSTDNTRYFVNNSSALDTSEWNSNCFEGLQFAITKMTFEF